MAIQMEISLRLQLAKKLNLPPPGTMTELLTRVEEGNCMNPIPTRRGGSVTIYRDSEEEDSQKHLQESVEAEVISNLH